MMKLQSHIVSKLVIASVLIALASSCEQNPVIPPVTDKDLTHITYDPMPVTPEVPSSFPALEQPDDNPMTEDGILLGRHLFYDPIMSRDSTISCSSCHLQASNFTDNLPVSIGIDGNQGKRSAMSLINIGFHYNGLFWDGRSPSLEEQSLHPIEDPNEMGDMWQNVEKKLQAHDDYPTMFRKAFGISKSSEITRELTTKAIAQFERTLISANSKFDRAELGTDVLTDLELDGHDIFFDINPNRMRHAECGHCHEKPLFTTNEYLNNGLETATTLNDFDDLGHGKVTGIPGDNGTFKVPTLRNIQSTGPFMHDGRMQTMDEVIDHYVTGGKLSPNKSDVMRPLTLSPYDRMALKAFISTLRDTSFLNNPAFSNPFL